VEVAERSSDSTTPLAIIQGGACPGGCSPIRCSQVEAFDNYTSGRRVRPHKPTASSSNATHSPRSLVTPGGETISKRKQTFIRFTSCTRDHSRRLLYYHYHLVALLPHKWAVTHLGYGRHDTCHMRNFEGGAKLAWQKFSFAISWTSILRHIQS